MSDPYEFVPPFVSPLNHDQHARLGRMAVLWGQIDMILDQLLQISLDISGQQRISLIGEKPIGLKLDLLKNNLQNLATEEARQMVTQFWDLANQTKRQRNLAFHGVWGFRCGKKEGDIYPAAGHFRNMDNPVKVGQFPALEKKLCKTARIGWRALSMLRDFGPSGCVRLFHGEPGDEPEWLPLWRAQHPMDDHDLDRNWKRGQLPYLGKRR